MSFIHETLKPATALETSRDVAALNMTEKKLS